VNNRKDKNRKLASHVRNVNLTFARANKYTMCDTSELKSLCYYAIVDITMQPPYVEGVAIQCDESSLDHCQPDSDSLDTSYNFCLV